MRAFVALLIAIFFSAPVAAFATELHFDFRTFKVRTHFSEAAAPLRWNEAIFPFQAAFRYGTPYKEMSEQPHRRFGGHYVMVTTGCGTALQCGVLVDRRTGKVVSQLPLATSGYDYRYNSALLVVNPTSPEVLANRDSFWEQTTYYYVWTTKGWEKLAEEPWPVTSSSGGSVAVISSQKDKSTLRSEIIRNLFLSPWNEEQFMVEEDRIPIPVPRPKN